MVVRNRNLYMSDEIKISIVTIVYNGEREIERTIKSVISQTYKNIEYVLVDGASKDNTMQIVEPYRECFHTIISEPDKGIYNAMNKGLGVVSGDYVIFANSGDCLASNDVLERVVDSIRKESQLPDMIYGNYRESGDSALEKEIPCYSHERAWYGMFASHQSIFYRLGLLRDNNIMFDETYKVAADYKLTLQAVVKGKTFLKLPICISSFDITGISCQNQDLGLYEADRVRKEVLNMPWIKRYGIILTSKTSRYVKKYLGFLYKLYRY